MSILGVTTFTPAMLSSSVGVNDPWPTGTAAKAKAMLADLAQEQFELTSQQLAPISAASIPLSSAAVNDPWLSSVMAIETLVAPALEQLDLTRQPRPGLSLLEVQAGVEFFEKLIDLIGLIKEKYLGPYTHILESYQKFFAAFTSKITSEMQWWIGSADEGKKVTINGGVFHRELDKLIRDFSLPNAAAVLFPEPGHPAATLEEAQKWQAALGLPASSVQRLPTGGYGVVMDLAPIKAIKAGTPSTYQVWDTARFQAWQHGFNAQEESMKNQLQSFTQKFSNANSYHDTFNRTLSAHLKDYTDLLKHMSTL
ncbi:IpaD/SipD/SspD family type III secretion system needle tip protein [Pseudomonas alkylphenolica]|uniref:IpaD/SipD/SspD family type III secretion system needle tip protein n=1 Tax=Pseudomonas alkylphenolica TaxID=237609 RepID=UPI0018D71FF2|nr:IpaD/SipD/SspD family type III secretion system needle tip protein [Pseudomonas alkylphenolica]MBH3427336.1 IpaD/SipD/SspD family type III secretion system needle tip protein [Pseudomonas alkylphenolica]